MKSALSKYLEPEILAAMAQRPFRPQGLVVGNLAGAHKSPLSGFAVEFAGHREYSPGDDPKHIDWRVYYTREKLFVKQYELETNFVCHLILDVSASMRYGEGDQQKMLYGAKLATAMAYAVVRQSDKISLSTFDTALRGYVPPSNHLDQVIRMTEHLDSIKPESQTDLGACLNELESRIGRREIVVVISDFFGDLDALESALQRLRYRKHEVVLFQVMHNDELEFSFDGMIKFLGLEVDQSLLAQPNDLRNDYLTAMRAFNEQLEEVALRNRCERVLIDTSRNPGEMMIDYMNRRSRLNRGR
jgi:uncharacterized protein (DUF58 family)